MEFLRFGSSIPGAYWGCCACDIIQNFKVDPDGKASIQLVDGDGGHPLTDDKGAVFVGPTWRDIFWQRIRFGTFDKCDMPNHAFIAILTDNQIRDEGSIGHKWLAILKEAGFEFIRAVSNSVYSGKELLGNDEPSDGSLNYIFGLFRNIGNGAAKDPFTPPKEWRDLQAKTVEPWSYIPDPVGYANQQREEQTEMWKTLPKPKYFSQKELVEAGVPVILAGKRSVYPQQSAGARRQAEATDKNITVQAANPFGKA